MAGFAVVMTFLTWGFFLLVLALVLGIVLYRKTKAAPRWYRLVSAAAPFVCLIWLAVALELHVTISNRLAHQSVGYSPDPYVTLPNGYVVGSLNTYSGYVRASGVSTDTPWVGPGYVRGIIDLALIDGRFTGTYLDEPSQFNPGGTGHIRNFVFDTRDRSIRTSDTQEATDFGGVQDRVHQDATSYWQIYAEYRHQWPTVIFWVLLLGGEAVIILVLIRIKP